MKTRIVLLSLLLFPAGAAAQERDIVARGQTLAEANCAVCHAIGAEDESAHAEAVPLRELSERYPIDALEEAFAEGIHVGHPDMPVFEAEPDQIAALLAYIESIQ